MTESQIETEAGSRSRREVLLNLLRFAALTYAVVWSVAFPVLSLFEPVDLVILMDATRGDPSGFYYTPWILPYLDVLASLPLEVAWIVVNLVNLAGFYAALRVFGGSRVLFFVSYPLLFTIYYGQLDGVYAFGLALMALALKRDSAPLAAVGWLLALVKYYVGLPLGLGVLLVMTKNRRVQRWTVVYVLLFGILSLGLWPVWPLDILARMQAIPPNDLYSFDLWQITGPLVLLLWIPVLLCVNRLRDLTWWAATWVLTTPYIYPHGLVHLLVHPVGLVGWGVQAAYITGFGVLLWLNVIPMVLYVQGIRRYYAPR